jgi:hypothetical protein
MPTKCRMLNCTPLIANTAATVSTANTKGASTRATRNGERSAVNNKTLSAKNPATE